MTPPRRPEDQSPGARRPMPPSVPPRPRRDAPPTGERRASSQGEPRTTRPRTTPTSGATKESPRRRRWPRVLGVLAAMAVVALVVTVSWVDSRIQHVTALSGAPGTPGDTYLIVGSDARDGWREDGTVGARTDTIMLLHKPERGPTALISLPRDSLVGIPGYGDNKINAAYAYGGAPLLVLTVEQLTGLTIDRYVEVGLLGVQDMVNALGGVELCYDHDVNDPYSEMVWSAGCHHVDGAGALAFSRMRYADPLGDIGRVQRQQQVVAAVAKGVMSPGTVLNPARARRVADAGLGSFRVSNGTRAWHLPAMAQAFNDARGEGAVTGTPPIASIDHRVDGVGSTVLLDPVAGPEFWANISGGTYPPGTQVGGY